MRLRQKIISLFVIAILLTFLPLVYIMQTKVKDANRNQIEEQVSELVDSRAKEIDLWLNQRISEIRLLLEFDEIQTMDMDKIRPMVEKINQSEHIKERSSDETFAIGLTNGLGYISQDFFIDVSERHYFKQVLKNESEYVISEPVLSRSDNQPIFLISFPVVNNQQDVIGFINGSVSLRKITDIAENIDMYQAHSWIMNRNNTIYSTNEEEILQDHLTEHTLDLIQDSFSYAREGKIKIKDSKGIDHTLFYHEIPNADNWILCTMVADDAIHAQTDGITSIIIRASLLFFLIVVLIAVFIANSVVQPIQDLQDNMEAVAHGNLDVKANAEGSDEIGQLAQYFNYMLKELQNLLQHTSKIEKQKRQAELKSLQSQINPHFLYNTLDTLQWKALEQENFDVADLINILSNYFRIVLSDGDEFISLEKEIDHVRYYLEIQQIRYHDILNYDILLDPKLKDVSILKLIIQPLVENSIYHGLKLKRETGSIKVSVEKDHDDILIRVWDNGIGMTASKLLEVQENLQHSIESDHYGLYNINERLKLYYHDDYKLSIESVENSYTCVTIKVPITRRNEDV